MSDYQPSIADLELLTAGSVWIRGDGKEARFLFMTNKNLSSKALAKFPSQVVYADEKDNILSVGLERFLEVRTFHHVDPGLESRLGNLLAYSGEASGDDDFSLDDDDVLTIDQGDGAQEVLDADGPGDVFGGAEDEDDPDSDGLEIEFYTSNPEAAPEISLVALQGAVECYQQNPVLDKNLLQHTLFIHAREGITRESLYKAFTPHSANGSTLLFKVKTANGLENVDWDNFLGIYPYSISGDLMFQVIFTSLQSFNVNQTEVVDTVVVGEAQGAVITEVAAAPAPTPAPAVEAVVAAPVPLPPAAVEVAATVETGLPASILPVA